MIDLSFYRAASVQSGLIAMGEMSVCPGGKRVVVTKRKKTSAHIFTPL